MQSLICCKLASPDIKSVHKGVSVCYSVISNLNNLILVLEDFVSKKQNGCNTCKPIFINMLFENLAYLFALKSQKNVLKSVCIECFIQTIWHIQIYWFIWNKNENCVPTLQYTWYLQTKNEITAVQTSRVGFNIYKKQALIIRSISLNCHI